MLVERDCVADLVGRKMSGAMERRDAAFYAGRNAQAERARTEAARTAALRAEGVTDAAAYRPADWAEPLGAGEAQPLALEVLSGEVEAEVEGGDASDDEVDVSLASLPILTRPCVSQISRKGGVQCARGYPTTSVVPPHPTVRQSDKSVGAVCGVRDRLPAQFATKTGPRAPSAPSALAGPEDISRSLMRLPCPCPCGRARPASAMRGLARDGLRAYLLVQLLACATSVSPPYPTVRHGFGTVLAASSPIFENPEGPSASRIRS